MEKIILTGLKPTGDITLGNYLGAIKQMVKFQDDYKSFIFVADLHALTTYQDPLEIRERIKKFIAMYIACGIDPKKNTIYLQSENEYIPAISYLLECTTYYGEASRMIQFKEKSKANANFSVGLLTYPILMSADILYCDSSFVPVGIDQKQHVELARNIAIRFNEKYKKIFTVPDVLINSNGAKIMNLKYPTKKMSKSEGDFGSISLFDSEEVVKEKIIKSTTDSFNKVKFDPINQPGISNLLTILSLILNEEIPVLEERFKDYNYKDFKLFVADIVANKIKEIRNKYDELINSDEIDKVLDEGIKVSRALAKEKYEQMKEAMGIIR